MDNDATRPMHVGFKGLVVSCVIGVRETERLRQQDVVLDVDLRYDAAGAIESDSLDYALDYSAVARWCSACLRDTSFLLLERACAALADGLFDNFPAATEVTVILRKPAALVDGDFSYASLQRLR